MSRNGSQIPDYVYQARKRTKNFLENYLAHRKEDLLVGEFLDAEGIQLGQFGLGGTSFLLALSRKHDLSGKCLITAEEILSSGIEKTEDARDAKEKKLLKDVPRFPAKSILLTLCLSSKRKLNQIIGEILNKGTVNNLLKPDLEYNSEQGDVFVTSYVLQIAKIADFQFTKSDTAKIVPLLEQVSVIMRESGIGIDRKLFLSTTLCLYDYDTHIAYHRQLLKELYGSERNWTKAFSTEFPFSDESPFLDIWYPDASSGSEKNRYLRIPYSYVALSSIYVGLGSEAAFFRFKPIENMIKDVTNSFDQQNSGDRTRSSAYYVFFSFLILYPSTYFPVENQGFSRRFFNRLTYSWNNLTQTGLIVLLLVMLGSGRLGFLIYDVTIKSISGSTTTTEFEAVVTTMFAILVGVLALTRTTKK